MAAVANKFIYNCPWSEDCDSAPWYLDYTTQKRMGKFADKLLSESCTPDAASMNLTTEQFVFVYGTLKRGFGAHDLLDDARFVGRGWTRLSRFKMFEAKDFPVVLFVHTEEEAAKAVHGEVYLVPTVDIKHLDKYESNGVLFKRRKLAVLLDSGETKIAWMYFGTPSVWSLSKLAPVFTRKKTGVEYYSYTKVK